MSYAGLSTQEITQRMNERYAARTAYTRTVLWDEVRTRELIEVFLELAGPIANTRILDIGVGDQGAAKELRAHGAFRCYVGIDLSEEGIAQAKVNNAEVLGSYYGVMDAMDLGFPDHSFDLIYAREILEHVPNQAVMLAECCRLLVSGGRMILSSPNRDSLHLRMNRILGHADFHCSIDHVRELTFDECSAMLRDAGFRIGETRGIFLLPYWGIPELDLPVRGLTDNEPTVIDWLRELGRRGGPEYAFCYVIRAEKP